MTAQIIYLPVIPRKPADRETFHAGEKLYHHGLPYWRTRYRCPDCGTEKTINHGALYVSPMAICNNYHGCGAEMRPVEAK